MSCRPELSSDLNQWLSSLCIKAVQENSNEAAEPQSGHSIQNSWKRESRVKASYCRRSSTGVCLCPATSLGRRDEILEAVAAFQTLQQRRENAANKRFANKWQSCWNAYQKKHDCNPMAAQLVRRQEKRGWISTQAWLRRKFTGNPSPDGEERLCETSASPAGAHSTVTGL